MRNTFYDQSLSARANNFFLRMGWTTEHEVVSLLPDALCKKHSHVGKKTMAELKAWLAVRCLPPLRLTFTINHPGETAAGISSYTDTVTVEVESGDPGGEEGEFAEFILTALREWYDGARVTKEG